MKEQDGGLVRVGTVEDLAEHRRRSRRWLTPGVVEMGYEIRVFIRTVFMRHLVAHAAFARAARHRRRALHNHELAHKLLGCVFLATGAAHPVIGQTRYPSSLSALVPSGIRHIGVCQDDRIAGVDMRPVWMPARLRGGY